MRPPKWSPTRWTPSFGWRVRGATGDPEGRPRGPPRGDAAGGRARSEALFERPHVELVRPRARVLMGEEPERVGDRRRLQQVFVRQLRQELAHDRHVDRAVDV